MVTTSVNVPGAEIVAGSIALLKVAAIFWLSGTPQAPLAGFGRKHGGCDSGRLVDRW